MRNVRITVVRVKQQRAQSCCGGTQVIVVVVVADEEHFFHTATNQLCCVLEEARTGFSDAHRGADDNVVEQTCQFGETIEDRPESVVVVGTNSELYPAPGKAPECVGRIGGNSPRVGSCE